MVECKHCGKEFDDSDLYDLFDYQTYFDVDCECGATLECEAQSVSEFVVLRTRPPAEEVPA